MSVNKFYCDMYVFSGISGYVATNMYKKMGGENWVWNINLTSALFARKLVMLSLSFKLYFCHRVLVYTALQYIWSSVESW